MICMFLAVTMALAQTQETGNTPTPRIDAIGLGNVTSTETTIRNMARTFKITERFLAMPLEPANASELRIKIVYELKSAW